MPDSGTGDLIRWAMATIIPAVSGLAGVALGAWATSHQEKWRAKRDTYAELLKCFADMEHAALRAALLKMDKSEVDRFLAAHRRLRRAIRSSLLTVNAEVSEALDAFQNEWNLTNDLPKGEEKNKAQRAAIDKATATLRKVGRQELKLK